jgi:trans-aconitate 2-methyltransferase
MSRDVWNPDQYEKFRDERAAPFYDLLALVEKRPGMRLVDLGCGTGDMTRVLHDTLQAEETVGIDNSDSMLSKTERYAGAGLSFEKHDIAEFNAEGSFDLVFSNAALHWISDHAGLFKRLTAALRPGGQLAVQMPANTGHQSHYTADEVAAEDPFRDLLGGYVRPSPLLKPEEYAVLLNKLGFRDQHVRLQVYGHLLESRDQVVEWVRGTRLTDYEKRLPPDLYKQFLSRYRELLMERLEETRPFLYTYNRIHLWGRL